MSGENIELTVGFDADQIAANLKKQVFDIVEDEFLKAVADLERNSPVGASASNGEPALKESWNIESELLSNSEIVIAIDNKAFPALNRLEGRKAGRQPPSDALIPWVEYKLKVKGKQAKSIAFLIARKIGLKGTTRSQRNFKEFNPATGEPVANSAVDRAIKRIQKRLDGIKLI